MQQAQKLLQLPAGVGAFEEVAALLGAQCRSLHPAAEDVFELLANLVTQMPYRVAAHNPPPFFCHEGSATGT